MDNLGKKKEKKNGAILNSHQTEGEYFNVCFKCKYAELLVQNYLGFLSEIRTAVIRIKPFINEFLFLSKHIKVDSFCKLNDSLSLHTFIILYKPLLNVNKVT